MGSTEVKIRCSVILRQSLKADPARPVDDTLSAGFGDHFIKNDLPVIRLQQEADAILEIFYGHQGMPL